MCSGQRRSAGSAQVSGEQVPEMDGSMALMAMEEGAGTGEVVALAGARVMVSSNALELVFWTAKYGIYLYTPECLSMGHLRLVLYGIIQAYCTTLPPSSAPLRSLGCRVPEYSILYVAMYRNR